MDEISTRYRRLAADFTRRVDAVREDQWANQTPCSEWSVRDLVAHVVTTERDVPTWAGLEPLPLSASPEDEPAAAWAQVREQVQALLDDPARAGVEYEGAFGPTTIGQSIDAFLGFDLLVHGWDIARATGQDEALPADEVRRVLAMAEGLGDNLRRGGVCGPAVPVPADASEQDRLLGLLGRMP
jgi:uncharacterized protein (TIGR03086 family)